MKDVIARVHEGQATLGLDRPRLRVVPVLSRLENNEYKDKLEWQRRVVDEMQAHVRAWDPEGGASPSVLEKIMVPYVPYFAYGERIAALLDSATAGTVGPAHAALAALLDRDLRGEEGVEPGDKPGRRYIYVGSYESAVAGECAAGLRAAGFEVECLWEPPLARLPGRSRAAHDALVEERRQLKARQCVELVRVWLNRDDEQHKQFHILRRVPA